MNLLARRRIGSRLFLAVSVGLLAAGACTPAWAADAAGTPQAVDTGDTAWVLLSAALVMLMTPGLAFFYGGLVRRK